MPLYDFECADCGVSKEVRVGYERSRLLALVCTGCGGEMHVTPVMKVSVITGGEKHDPAAPAARTAKPCGHVYHCRCSIKLDRPNPFEKEIRAATGQGDEE